MSDLRTRILARLDRWDEEHDASGCPVTLLGDCIHSAGAAVRAVLDLAGQCVPRGWSGLAQQRETERVIAEALGIEVPRA